MKKTSEEGMGLGNIMTMANFLNKSNNDFDLDEAGDFTMNDAIDAWRYSVMIALEKKNVGVYTPEGFVPTMDMVRPVGVAIEKVDLISDGSKWIPCDGRSISEKSKDAMERLNLQWQIIGGGGSGGTGASGGSGAGGNGGGSGGGAGMIGGHTWKTPIFGNQDVEELPVGVFKRVEKYFDDIHANPCCEISLDGEHLDTYNRRKNEIVMKSKECDCGAMKTYGKDCKAGFHSSWCSSK